MRWHGFSKYLQFVSSVCIVSATVYACSAPKKGAEASGGSSSNVQVELSKDKLLWLHVTLRCRAKTRATFYKDRLPWGNYNSMEFVAVTPDEHYIERVWPIDDPVGFEETSMAPNEMQSGDVDLRMKFIGLDAAIKKSSVRLFWAYHAPEQLNISEWPGGLIFIPQQK